MPLAMPLTAGNHHKRSTRYRRKSHCPVPRFWGILKMVSITPAQSNQMKGFAILLVFIYHSTGYLKVPNYSAGQIGVDLFLFASGYGIAQSIDRYSSFSEFMQRRLARLL